MCEGSNVKLNLSSLNQTGSGSSLTFVGELNGVVCMWAGGRWLLLAGPGKAKDRAAQRGGRDRRQGRRNRKRDRQKEEEEQHMRFLPAWPTWPYDPANIKLGY